MKENCIFCNDEFEHASIKKYNYWDLQLFINDQYYIGRSVAILKSRHINNMLDLNIKERIELFDFVLKDINKALNSVFVPDLYNYTDEGNDCEHLHIHIIPRYNKPVKFDGEAYIDEYWGQTYSQNYSKIKLSKEKQNKLISLIKNNI